MSHMQTKKSSSMHWKMSELFVKSTNLSCSKVSSMLRMLHHHHSFNADVNCLDIFSHKCEYAWITSRSLAWNSLIRTVSLAVFKFMSQGITFYYNLSQSLMFSNYGWPSVDYYIYKLYWIPAWTYKNEPLLLTMLT